MNKEENNLINKLLENDKIKIELWFIENLYFWIDLINKQVCW